MTECVTLVHECEFATCRHKDRIKIRYGASRHDVTAYRLEKNQNKTTVTEQAHNCTLFDDDAHQTKTVPQCETCRNVANLQPGEPAQLLEHGQKDLGLVRWQRLHRLPKHCPHVAKSARRAKHNSYKNRSQSLKKSPSPKNALVRASLAFSIRIAIIKCTLQ